jgi:hypothetical protein
VSYGHAEQKLNDLDMEIKELLAKAEQADSTPLQDGLPSSLGARMSRRTGKKLQRRSEPTIPIIVADQSGHHMVSSVTE